MKISDEAVEAATKAYENACTYRDQDTIRAALEAALPHLSQGAVRVKPLEWREVSAHGEAALVGYGLWGEFSRIPLVRNITATEIRIRQCKAEDDYERRILSALSPAPVGVTAADIRLKIALWSDDEGLELSMRQGDELARSILSALASHEPAPTDTQEGLSVTGEVEPVAWLAEGYGYQRVFIEREAAEKMARGGTLTPLYASPYDTQSALTACQQEAERLREEKRDAYHNGYASRDGVVNACRTRAKAAEVRIAELEKALKFYADVSKYPAPLTGGMGDLWSDCGERARAALSQNGEEE